MSEPRRERKVVTVLFCDLVGFTSQAESLDPEDVDAFLRSYHERVSRELERHGGTVEKFVGDAVMALFGAPQAHEDDPERAVRAALAIRSDEDLRVRIGITTGEALVTLGGGPTAAGDVVNTASRLQAAAPEGAILVDETTYRATRSAIDYAEAAAIEAKGKAEPVAAWEAAEARSRPGVDVEQRAEAPLVGRGEELSALRDALGRARRASEPQLVTLVGVPGIGKSRLVYELFRAVDADPELIVWRQGRSLPYGEGVTFWAVAEMVKAQAGILETDGREDVEEKLRRAVEDVAGDQADWVLGHLRRLLGVAPGEEAAGERQAETFAAWRAFFEGIAERNATVLVFEDLQWADDGVLDFVDHLVDWSSGVPLLVVCTARPELLARRDGWGGGKPNAVTISLAPLSDDETARLVHGLLERAVLDVDVRATVLARAGGNPLYAEEFARIVAERGALTAGQLPESVQGIIAARLDSLAPEEKALLQDAAVVGKVFWAGAAAALGDRDRWQVEEAFHVLERKEFVRRERRSSVAGETEYAFRHLLVRDVAYNQIPRAERAERHRRAAEWVESLGPAGDRAEMLAHHYLQALEFARAAGQTVDHLLEPARTALFDAGERARGLEVWPAAAGYYRAALELADERDPVLVLRCAETLYASEGTGEELMREARDGLLARGDVERAAEAEVLLARSAWRRGEAERANTGYGRAVDLVENAPPSRARADVLLAGARNDMVGGRYDESVRRAYEALEIASELELPDIRAGALMTIGSSRIEQGQSDALADFRRGLELAVELNSSAAISGYIGLADMLIEEGDLQGGLEARAEARRMAERLGAGVGLDWVHGERAGELYTLGRWDEALRQAEEFIAWSTTRGRHYLESANRQVRGGVLLARGDVGRALEDAEASLELGRGAEDPQVLYPALAFTARVYFAAGRAEAAVALLDQLLDQLRATGDAPIGYVWLRSAAASFRALGRGGEFVGATAALRKRTPWLDAAAALAAGESASAAECYAELGAKPDEAFARLAAADDLLEEGRRADADAQLERALDFLRSVRAEALVQRAEKLRAASA